MAVAQNAEFRYEVEESADSTGWKTTSHFTAKVGASDGAKGDQFGWSVSLGGNLLLVGAPSATTAEGEAYLFEP